MMRRRRPTLALLVICVLVLMGIGEIATAQDVSLEDDNLLINGNFDQLPFKWFYPNHHIAGGWERWWIHGTIMPEFDDVAKPGGVRREFYVDGGHAQVYFKWGINYTAGIYQTVSGLMPCRPYQLTMHTRTHSLGGVHPHARIGLDPLGVQLSPHGGAVDDPTPLNRAAWSREQEVLFTWEELAVTTEPLGDRLTAILYASPQPASSEIHYYDTFWDAGALRPATYADGRLPGPVQATGGFIGGVGATQDGSNVSFTWNLAGPGLTQIWYKSTALTPITDTTHLTYTTYMPLLGRFSLDFSTVTPLDYGAAQGAQTATISVPPGQVVSYVAVARRLVDGACVTEYAGPYTLTTQP